MPASPEESLFGARPALAAFACLAVLTGSCLAEAPPRGPEATCTKACEQARQCTGHECARGCNLVLDRLVENEGQTVLACIERHRAPCDDRAWAHCATLVGVHADGGPPPPGPPRLIDEDGDDEGD